MIKFLLQTVNNKVRHDFVFEMEHAIDYQNWKEPDSMTCKYCNLEDIVNLSDDYKDYVPIGTIEFVHTFIDKFIKPNGSKELKPLNVPEVLEPFTGRFIRNVELTEDWNSRENVTFLFREECLDSREVFVKSNDTIKSKLNDFYSLDHILDYQTIPNGNYQVSEVVNILSEYRCFVYKDNLVGIQYYSGDFTVFPYMDDIYEMLDYYNWNYDKGEAPEAFTLDVAVLQNGDTVVMEVHDFYSCGLYGFNDYNYLPYMFKRTFDNIKKKLA